MTDSAPAIASVRRALETKLRDSAVVVDHPLGEMTTYRVGGRADLFVDVGSRHDLDVIAEAITESRCAVLVIGRGSNLLVSDAGFRGLALRLSEEFASISVAGTTVVAGAGASLPVVARSVTAGGLGGFEWAVGVPGSVGGAVRMNAGGHGSDMQASVTRVRVVDLATGDSGDLPAPALEFAYRHSAITPTQVVVAAELELHEADPEAGAALVSEIVRWRRAHQPGGQNAGSVFTNPPGDSAGRLIDTAGLKGRRIGSAEVSTKHANFIQADAGGSADDVHALMDLIVREVREQHGVVLRAETCLVGFEVREEGA